MELSLIADGLVNVRYTPTPPDFIAVAPPTTAKPR